MHSTLSHGLFAALHTSGPRAVAMLTILSCVGLAACGGGNSTTNPTSAPTPVPTPAPTPSPAPAPSAGPAFHTVDIGPIANGRESNISSPVGRRTFAGVPFDMGSGQFAAFISQHEGHPEYPTEATLALSAGTANLVHILLTGVYVVSVAASRTVGEITLGFADGAALTVPVVSWSTFREGWRYTDEPTRAMTAPAPPVTWDNVLEQPQTRAGRPALGLIDRITIQIPDNLTRVALVSLRLRDTSSSGAQSISPGLSVHAVTLESR